MYIELALSIINLLILNANVYPITDLYLVFLLPFVMLYTLLFVASGLAWTVMKNVHHVEDSLDLTEMKTAIINTAKTRTFINYALFFATYVSTLQVLYFNQSWVSMIIFGVSGLMRVCSWNLDTRTLVMLK